MIKLIAFDIDDTLLSSQQQILPRTKTAIAACVAKGIHIVLCSGRPFAGVAPWLAQLGLQGADEYAITNNGAIVYTAAGTVVAKQLIDNAGYRRLTAYAQAHDLAFNVLDDQSRIYTADRDVDAVTVVQAWENQAGLLIREPSELSADFAIAKGLFVGNVAQLDAAEAGVKATFGKDHDVVRAGSRFLEVMAPKVNKGAALTALGQRLDIPATQMMAFGDSGNDLSMFAAVHTAVCMGNGTPEARAAADVITATNDDDGIAKALVAVLE